MKASPGSFRMETSSGSCATKATLVVFFKKEHVQFVQEQKCVQECLNVFERELRSGSCEAETHSGCVSQQRSKF